MRTIWNALRSRENGTTARPQTRRCPEIINYNSAEYGQSTAEAILNRPARRFCTDKNQQCPSCNPAGFMVQYLSIHKDVSDSACCVVRHTDAGPVRWGRCEPGQVGNQAALSGAPCAFQSACIRMPSYARRGQNPVERCPFIFAAKAGKGETSPCIVHFTANGDPSGLRMWWGSVPS